MIIHQYTWNDIKFRNIEVMRSLQTGKLTARQMKTFPYAKVRFPIKTYKYSNRNLNPTSTHPKRLLQMHLHSVIGGKIHPEICNMCSSPDLLFGALSTLDVSHVIITRYTFRLYTDLEQLTTILLLKILFSVKILTLCLVTVQK